MTIRMVGGDTLEVLLPPGPARRELAAQMAELAKQLGIAMSPGRLTREQRPRAPDKRPLAP